MEVVTFDDDDLVLFPSASPPRGNSNDSVGPPFKKKSLFMLCLLGSLVLPLDLKFFIRSLVDLFYNFVLVGVVGGPFF